MLWGRGVSGRLLQLYAAAVICPGGSGGDVVTEKSTPLLCSALQLTSKLVSSLRNLTYALVRLAVAFMRLGGVGLLNDSRAVV